MYTKELNEARRLFNARDFRRAYDFLKTIPNKCAEWYYLTGVSAMNIGFYEEGEDYIKRARFMEPNNGEYNRAFNEYIQHRSNYNERSYDYNRQRQANLDGCACSCCNDDCCSCCCKLWCIDTLCECCGGDCIPCI